jgi:beta-lactamase regulating signal transducer with metallopeptidase domain
MTSWMIAAVAFTALLGLAARIAEAGAAGAGLPRRAVWVVALLASVLLPGAALLAGGTLPVRVLPAAATALPDAVPVLPAAVPVLPAAVPVLPAAVPVLPAAVSALDPASAQHEPVGVSDVVAAVPSSTLAFAAPSPSGEAAHATPAAVGVMSSLVEAGRDVLTAAGGVVASATHRVAGRAGDTTRLLTAVWLVLSLLVLCAYAQAWARFRHARRGWRAGRLCDQQVLLARDAGPAVFGLRRASIVLPEWVAAAPPQVQRMIVLHEAEHARAGDHVLLAFAPLALVLLPWNLPLWWAVHRLRLAVELDCDRRVLARGVPAREYGSLLLDIVGGAARLPTAAAALAEPRTFLERRIIAMSTPTPRRPRLRAAAFSLVAIVMALGACQTVAPLTARDAVPTARGERPEQPTQDAQYVQDTLPAPDAPASPKQALVATTAVRAAAGSAAVAPAATRPETRVRTMAPAAPSATAGGRTMAAAALPTAAGARTMAPAAHSAGAGVRTIAPVAGTPAAAGVGASIAAPSVIGARSVGTLSVATGARSGQPALNVVGSAGVASGTPLAAGQTAPAARLTVTDGVVFSRGTPLAAGQAGSPARLTLAHGAVVVASDTVRGQPLFIVDGVILPADMRIQDLPVSADDIVHIEVLRGPAAVQKHGERAAHGAIEITTRLGPGAVSAAIAAAAPRRATIDRVWRSGQLVITTVPDSAGNRLRVLNRAADTAGVAHRVIIRQPSSIGPATGPAPLFVVDGVIVAAEVFDAIPAGRIESIEVIKGAAAVQLYGARAVGGVISVVTRR